MASVPRKGANGLGSGDYSSILDRSFFVCLAAHDLEFLGWTPGNVRLLLPPG